MSLSSNYLNTVQKDSYKIESPKSKNNHKEPIIVGFFILQYAKLKKLELYYNFFDKFCIKKKFEEVEMDTDSLYLLPAEEILYVCICSEKKCYWEKLTEIDCRDSFRADSKTNLFHRTCCSVHKNTINERLDCSKKNLGAWSCYVYVAKLIAAMTTNQTKQKKQQMIE